LPVQDFVALEDHLILEVEPGARLLGEHFAHRFIARLRGRFFVMVGEDGLDVQLARDLRNRVARVVMHHHEVAAGLA